MILATNMILTVTRTGYICVGASKFLDDYAAVWKSIVMKRNISSVMKKFFSDGAFVLQSTVGLASFLCKERRHLYNLHKPYFVFM